MQLTRVFPPRMTVKRKPPASEAFVRPSPGNRGRDGIPIVDGQEPSWSMKSAAGIGRENIG